MGETKIKIDLGQGTIEAEGSEEFVRSIYADFKEKIHAAASTQPNRTKRIKQGGKEEKKTAPKIKKRKAGAAKPAPQLVKALDLSGKGKKSSLKEFYTKYTAKSFFEKNLVFCYYLQEEVKETPITADHVFTCYRHIPGIKAPKALAQSLLDTSHHKGWLDTSSLDNITVPIAGINYLEHDLPKAEGK
jgi:hypothetical protein